MSQDHLSQEDIDAVLRQLRGDGEAAEGQELLTEYERDILAEIANISMGAAATAASEILNRKVVITAPVVSLSSPHEVVADFEPSVLIVTVHYIAGLEGTNVFILRQRDAAVIADLMMGGDGTSLPEQLDELHLSAVTEAMNQMMGSAATAMSGMFNLRVDITPPKALNAGDWRGEFARAGSVAAVVSFRITIDGLIDSTFVQISPISFVKQLVEMAVRSSAGAMEAAAVEAAVEPVEGQAAATPSALAEGSVDAAQQPAAPPAAGPALQGTPQPVVQSASPAASQPAPRPEPQPVSEPVSEPAPQPDAVDESKLSLELVKDIPVEVTAILGEAEMRMRDVLVLTAGAVVHLNTEVDSLVRIYANGVEIAQGEVVVVGENYGVRIRDVVGPARRLDSLKGSHTYRPARW